MMKKEETKKQENANKNKVSEKNKNIMKWGLTAFGMDWKSGTNLQFLKTWGWLVIYKNQGSNYNLKNIRDRL